MRRRAGGPSNMFGLPSASRVLHGISAKTGGTDEAGEVDPFARHLERTPLGERAGRRSAGNTTEEGSIRHYKRHFGQTSN